MSFPVFVSCPKGLEYLLEEELISLGFSVGRVSPQGVFGDVSLDMIYRVCLWSRLASRVHLILLEGQALNKSELYVVCRAFSWEDVFSADKTIAVTFHGESSEFRNTLFGAQVIKDAIVDYFRDKNNTRPSVARNASEVLIHGYLKNDHITVSLDLTGYSLHQRGYRLDTGIAPLKEHVAAALLKRARWQQLAKQGFALHDPCCGAGTLVIEAAMMAANIAPGMLRTDQTFQWWKGHDPSRWDALLEEAKQAIQAPDVRLLGSDSDATLIKHAKANAQRAGVSDWVEWEAIPLALARPIQPAGLLITNPPYGVRIGDEATLELFYRELGSVLHAHYAGWQAGILTPSVTLARAIGLRSHKQYTIYNGALLCKLYCITLDATNQFFEAPRPMKRSEGASMFANRLQKNHAHLQKWAKREQISCYRVYDADLPEYSFAIDLYQDYVVIQEYAAPNTIDPLQVETRRQEAIRVLPEVLNIPKSHVIVKERKQQKGSQQYEKLDQKEQALIVTEGRAKFKVNLTNYLDTGLFLDHRPLRLQFASLKPGTRFLNCFCYTASASVHAALAGAMTVNVDLSNTYLSWAEENFKLNHIPVSRHQFIQYDCLEWLRITQDKFDVIFLDPPSFSNSKRMATTLDIQRDHEMLIENAMHLLTEEGILYFSTNLRSFKLSPKWAETEFVKDITPTTIDLDFKRNPRIHQCFKIIKPKVF
jgi:23S rRNA (guanine2445-N2)-methyltransferase / 23S rRNA (guanine2069-N7)-methyltransferase